MHNTYAYYFILYFFGHPQLLQPGIKPVLPAVEAHSLNHWTTRKSWVHTTPASSPSAQVLSCLL